MHGVGHGRASFAPAATRLYQYNAVWTQYDPPPGVCYSICASRSSTQGGFSWLAVNLRSYWQSKQCTMIVPLLSPMIGRLAWWRPWKKEWRTQAPCLREIVTRLCGQAG